MDINKAADVKGRVGPPKSKASYRVLPVSMLLLNFLSHHRRAVENMAAGMGAAWRERGLVFPNSFGGYIPHSVLTRAAKRVIAGTGIAPELHPHSLRHTFASVLIRGGADIKTVQALLGHGSAHTTLNIYSHSFDEARAAAMNGAGDAIFGGAEMAALAPPPDQNLIKLDQYLINVERKNAQNGATG
jgi:integrase